MRRASRDGFLLRRSGSGHHDAHDLQHRGAEQHHEQGGEDKENQREEQFRGNLRCIFFNDLAPPRAQLLGLDAQRQTDACTEAVGLDQHLGQGVDIFHTHAQGEVAQHFFLRAAGAHLERH